MDQAGPIVGSSAAIREVDRLVAAAATSDGPVLFTGESGTGRHHAARALHERSPRRSGPFVALRRGTVPETQLERALSSAAGSGQAWGYREPPAPGDARGGTLFLGEVADLSPGGQARLLKLLQEADQRRAADGAGPGVRVVAATERPLLPLVQAGRFREELFYRLHLLVIPLPPLRDRIGDLQPLAGHLLQRAAERGGRWATRISPEALERLRAWRWPGNVAELERVLLRAASRARGETVEAADLPPEIARLQPAAPAAAAAPGAGMSYVEAKEAALRRFEQGYVESLLEACGGNISAAARRAGMDRSNFKRILRKVRGEAGSGPGAGVEARLRQA